MDIARKIGIGVVMIIPTFVGGGAVWELFGNWFAVFVWVVILGILSGKIISGKWIPMSSWLAIFVWVLIMGVLINRILKSNYIPFFG